MPNYRNGLPVWTLICAIEYFLWGPYKYQKALYTGKHFYLPKSTEKKHARKGLYAMRITILCVLDNKDVYIWQEKVYDPKT